MNAPDIEDDHHAAERVPGLFRLWELALVLEPGGGYRVEGAGFTEDGAPLVAVWRELEAIPAAERDGGRT